MTDERRRINRFGTAAPVDARRLGAAAMLVAKALDSGDGAGGADEQLVQAALWWSDFESYRTRGHSVTGAEYVRRAEGPVAVRWCTVLDDLAESGACVVDTGDDRGVPQRLRVVAGHSWQADGFDSEDLDLLRAAAQRFASLTPAGARALCRQTSAGWQHGGDGDTIPYPTAIIDTAGSSDDTIAWARSLAVAAGAAPQRAR